MTVTYRGYDWVVFPHSPDWSRLVSMKRRWKNVEAEALDGTEDRFALSTRPRFILGFDVIGQDRDESLRIIARVNAARRTGRCAIPLWGRAERITSAASGTTVTIANTTVWGWDSTSLLFIHTPGSAPEEFDVIPVESVADNTTLTLSSALSRTYPIGSVVYPVLAGVAVFDALSHESDEHFAASVQIEATAPAPGASDEFGASQGEDDVWEDPLIPLTVRGTASGDETVVVSGVTATPQENVDVVIDVKGGMGPYTVVSQDGLGTKTGWRTTWGDLGQGTWCFDVTDAAGATAEVCVRVYREEYSISYGEGNPYVARFTNNTAHDAQFYALHYGGVFNLFLLTSTEGEYIIPAGGSGFFIYGPEGSLSGFIGVNGLGVKVPAIYVSQGNGIASGGNTTGTVVPWRITANADGSVTFTEGPWTETIGRA